MFFYKKSNELIFAQESCHSTISKVYLDFILKGIHQFILRGKIKQTLRACCFGKMEYLYNRNQ